MQEAQNRRNEASKSIGAAMAKGEVGLGEELKLEVGEIKRKLPELEAEEARLSGELTAKLAALPNIPEHSVPAGADEAGNVEVARWGDQRNFAFEPKEHADIGPALGPVPPSTIIGTRSM